MPLDLITLAQWLAGEFDNLPQAQDQPAWFVGLRLWHRPLPWRIDGNLALFCEQANALYPEAAYRQRVVVLKPEGGGQVEYRAFQQPERVKGSGANPALLAGLTPADLVELSGCRLTIRQQGERFRAEPEPEAKCCFQYNGETRQVILGFEATAEQFWSHDRGVDPNTGKLLWGALMGAYEFHKRQDFKADLPL
ncbi:MAG: chromophore lyase CpcT/CpeT [Elainella sp.]